MMFLSLYKYGSNPESNCQGRFKGSCSLTWIKWLRVDHLDLPSRPADINTGSSPSHPALKGVVVTVRRDVLLASGRSDLLPDPRVGGPGAEVDGRV